MLSHLYLSVHTISTQLKKFFWLYFLTYFDFNNPCTFHFLCPHQICSNKPTVSNSSSLSTLASSYINYNSFHVFYIKLHIYRLLAYTSELFILPYIKKYISITTIFVIFCFCKAIIILIIIIIM